MEQLKDLSELLIKLVSEFTPIQSFLAFLLIVSLAAFRKQIPVGARLVFSYLTKDKESPKPKVFRHDIFNLIEETSLNSETIIVKGKAVKTVMFKDSVKTILPITKSNLETLVSDENSYSLTDPQLLSEIDKVLHRITKEFNSEFRSRLKNQGLTQSDISFILSYLSPLRLRNMEIIKRRCTKIFISDYYPTNQDKLVSFLEIMAFTIETLIPLSINAFELMNGRFDKYSWDATSGQYIQGRFTNPLSTNRMRSSARRDPSQGGPNIPNLN